MASPSPISAEDAKASIEREGVYVLQDPLVGSRVGGFRNSGFPIKSPLGFEMLAQNSLYREDIRAILRSILAPPYWGLIKVYGDKFPHDYAYRFHNGSDAKMHTLLLQLWAPKTMITFYNGSHTLNIQKVDEGISKQWGLLANRRDHTQLEGRPHDTVTLESGGLVLSDSRLLFTILEGYVIMIGFTTPAELNYWDPMQLPTVLKTKLEELQAQGYNINYQLF